MSLPVADLLTPELEGKLADLLSIDRNILLVETRRFVQLAHQHGIGVVDLDRQRCLIDERVYEGALHRLHLAQQTRGERQQVVADWCAAAFGPDAATSLPQRGVRLLEEAVELFQACGGDPAMAHKLIDFVFARPVGAIGQEIGGVSVVLLSLAQAAGLSAEAEETREVARVLAKPASHWAARNAEKNAAGFDTSASGADRG